MTGYLFTFASTHDGIAVRRALQGRCAFTVLPTPRAITASCGIAVLVPEAELPAAQAALRDLALGPERAALYRVLHEDGAEHFEPVEPQNV